MGWRAGRTGSLGAPLPGQGGRPGNELRVYTDKGRTLASDSTTTPVYFITYTPRPTPHTRRAGHRFPGSAQSATPQTGRCSLKRPSLSKAGPLSTPRVTCPNEDKSSSQSSTVLERARKCPGAGTGASGLAACAFVPPAAGLPRRRHSQYVSPGPSALPPRALPATPFPSRPGPGCPRVSGGIWENASPPPHISEGGFGRGKTSAAEQGPHRPGRPGGPTLPSGPARVRLGLPGAPGRAWVPPPCSSAARGCLG